ncbi:Dihydrouridine synthase (Dus) [Novymonas esmeraldas]|uniref:tRNA-dihydrouridine(47) synthase [NAD(P)(+)] n=1 Tax=Novymonas esmeraldas TaxID=1808958 RepID=A0AAW0ENQ8_9TRYP
MSELPLAAPPPPTPCELADCSNAAAVSTPPPPPPLPGRPAITADKGVCPVRPEYLRPAPARVSLDAEGRTRGMNKGAAREHSEFVQGTQRPTWEGEQNFFLGGTLQKIKAAVRETKQHQPKQPPPPQPKSSSSPGADAAVSADAPAAEHAAVAGGGEPVAIGQKRERSTSAGDASDVPAVEGGGVAGGATVLDATTKRGDEGPASRPSQTEEALREVVARQSSSRGLFANKLVLAPLTTVGNLPFRRVCKSFGADVTLSEMAVVFNLNRLQKNEWSLLRRHESEDIFGIQLAVSRPQEAATFAQALEASGFSYDFLDINCGCPVEKIVKSGCGCGLWERTGRLRDVVENLAIHQSRPVSIKCRIGPDEEAPSLHRQIHQYSTWGAAAVTVHGRSRKQRYTKFANWDYVDQCAQLTPLPVVGNGDIMSLEDVLEHRERQPHVTSHMIGRGALIKPWIFEEIKSGQVRDISSSERLDMLKEFCRCGMAHWGADERGVMTTRRFLCEWLSFLHRYVPVGLLERLPQRINERPPFYEGRDELETLMSSDSVTDWIRISELLLGPVEDKFRFTPKHKSNSYTSAADPDGGIEAEG